MTETVYLCVHTFHIFGRYGHIEVTHKVIRLIRDLRSPLILFSHYLPRSPSFSVSVSPGHRPSGCRAKWSVSEEGHPLGMAFRTNTAAAFPLLYPSVGFGPLLWTTAQIWPGFSKHACTAARPLYTGLFCKYCRQQLNVGKGPELGGFGQWDGSNIREKIIPTISTSHKFYF